MPRIGERGWIHSGAKVYDNTAAPTSWTDLDLSGIVGKNRALVFLKWKNRHATNTNSFFLRSNGETEEVVSGYVFASANNIAYVDAGQITHFVMETDQNGIIEWKGGVGHPTDIWVLGYIR